MGSDDVQTILAMISQQNIHILVRSLHRMEIQWAGVGQALTASTSWLISRKTTDTSSFFMTGLLRLEPRALSLTTGEK